MADALTRLRSSTGLTGLGERKRWNTVYPLTLGPDGSYLKEVRPVSSRMKFLLQFFRGQYIGRPSFGTEVQDIEQYGGDSGDLIKMELLEIRDSIQRNIRDMQLLAVQAENDTLNNRKVQFFITFREITGETKTVNVLNRDPRLST